MREAAPHGVDPRPDTAELWQSFFRLQAAYLLLWSIVERYTALRFGARLPPTQRVTELGKDGAFRAAVAVSGVVSGEVIDSRDPEQHVRLTNDGRGAAKYFYQIRSNLSHRGKSAFQDAQLVHKVVAELHNAMIILLASQMPRENADLWLQERNILNGRAAVRVISESSRSDPALVPIGWRHLGRITLDEGGGLVFPAVGAVPGIYRFTVTDGTQVVAGYIGQAAVSLKSRFNLYRSRGKRPSYPLERKTTSRNARFLIDALLTGNSVDVDLVDEHSTDTDTDGQTVALDLADEAFRASLERRLISELCSTGINVLNRNGNPRR